jgi:type IV pilus assembly protein PilY1
MHKFLLSISSFLFSVCIGFSAFADDLDIYLGTTTSAQTYNPNVLFIMDTSGSMTSKDGGSESRMLRVQNALKSALGSATNINAGLMRFSDYGGPILYPVADISASIDTQMAVSTGESGADGYEVSTSVNLTSDNIVMSQGTEVVHSAFRFDDISIPQGAVITNAYVRLVTSTTNVALTEFNIAAELADTATEISTSSSAISDLDTTLASVTWNTDNEFDGSDEQISTPDISGVVQEVVDQTGWCGGQAINIIFTGQGLTAASYRRVRSYDEGSGLSPQLVINYDDTTATGCVKDELQFQVSDSDGNLEEKSNGRESTGPELTFDSSRNSYIGLHFSDINIPQGATITSAYLEFVAYGTDTSGNASMVIRAIDTDDADDFSDHDNYMLRDVAKTGSVSWAMPEFRRNNTYQSDDISSVVSTIVNRSGWQSGNDIAFVLSDFSQERGAYSYQGKPSSAPMLYIEYQGNAEAGTSSTVRELLITKVDELSASGYTPIVDTLYEAVQYYAGGDVYYGLTRGSSSTSSTVRKNTRVSHRDSYTGLDAVQPDGCSDDDLSDSDCIYEYIPTGAEYISPVTDLQCQTNNHIVLLSDGEANYNHSVDEIEALLGESCASTSSGETCGLELVSNVSTSATSVIDRRITTHTIGFETNSSASDFLNQIALQSGGGFYEADDSDELLEAFETILSTVKDVNATFVSPGVAVNQLNRLTHNDELYYALFKPAEGTLWPGNLKRYRLDGDEVVDSNGLTAVDSNTGFFSDTSHSYWSVLTDGSDVREGGTASLLSSVRNVYAFDNTGSIITSSNLLHESNSAITTTQLNIESESSPTSLRESIIKWARGVDVRDWDGDGDITEVRLEMGDPIHSQPVIVSYDSGNSAIFIATNHGFLHSFDTDSGLENFAIIPTDLLPNLYDFYQNNSSYQHVYGLDGHMVLREFDDKKYLYVGMRRGGRNYYTFDISDENNPKLLFALKGGDTGLEKLGETWSKPIITQVNIGGTVKNVMIVGGGYDDDQDTNSVRTSDSQGNAVFMFDADTGDLLWQASNEDADLNLEDMVYGIPGQVAAIDRNNDGLVDHIYVSDMGGQLFRIDIYNGNSTDELARGGLIADFAGDTEASNRHFYYGPDVAEISFGTNNYYAVALGSGWRSTPLDTVVEDRFYMLKDESVFSVDEDGYYVFPETSTEADLYDATDHELTSDNEGVQGLAASAFSNADGWYIRLTVDGEKVLAAATIINYKIFFTTYVPAASSTSACATPTGNSRAYLVNLIDANAVQDLNDNDSLDSSDRYAELQQTGIAPDTKILIEDITTPVICLGTECVSTVIDSDTSCDSDFACLSENIFGDFERVQRGSWYSEQVR